MKDNIFSRLFACAGVIASSISSIASASTNVDDPEFKNLPKDVLLNRIRLESEENNVDYPTLDDINEHSGSSGNTFKHIATVPPSIINTASNDDSDAKQMPKKSIDVDNSVYEETSVPSTNDGSVQSKAASAETNSYQQEVINSSLDSFVDTASSVAGTVAKLTTKACLSLGTYAIKGFMHLKASRSSH